MVGDKGETCALRKTVEIFHSFHFYVDIKIFEAFLAELNAGISFLKETVDKVLMYESFAPVDYEFGDTAFAGAVIYNLLKVDCGGSSVGHVIKVLVNKYNDIY